MFDKYLSARTDILRNLNNLLSNTTWSIARKTRAYPRGNEEIYID